MSNSLSAISDDIDEYLWLCNTYKEPVQFTTTAQGASLPDCYGKHQQKLWNLHRENTKAGTEVIADERARQIGKEKWTSEHDDHHTDGEMLFAAIAYVKHANGDRGHVSDWPWDASWWKPNADPVRDLAKAGALIAAEIDRLKRERMRKLKAKS